MNLPVKINSDEDISIKVKNYGFSEQLLSSLTPYETIRLIQISPEFDSYTNNLLDKQSDSTSSKLLLHKLNDYLWLKRKSVV